MPGFHTFSAAEVLTAANMTTYFVQQAIVIKAADESVTSSTTLQDDNEITFSVAANTDYWLEALIIFSADPAGDLKIQWSGPASATLDWITDGGGSAAAATVDVVSRTMQGISSTPGHGGVTNNSTILCALHKGLLRVAGTAGTFKLTWAQLASSVNATFVRADSVAVLTRAS